MKKLLTMILALMIACGCLFSAASAETSGMYEYTLKSDGTAEITSVDMKCNDTVIPAELDGHKVTSIGRSAFFYCTYHVRKYSRNFCHQIINKRYVLHKYLRIKLHLLKRNIGS